VLAEVCVKLRCVVDGLELHAELHPASRLLRAYDGGESFILDALEAKFYEIAAASADELLALERSRYRLLRRAGDFQHLPG
jgi:hypothetical protein